jgi:peptidoglycan/xylan/chitin deacetylase (PgdA/CDA1 family)
VSALKRGLKRMAAATLAPLAPLSWRMRSGRSLLVLTYHRVLPAEHPDRAIEQPGMYVSPTTLDLHLTLLKRHFPIVHLDDWLRSAASGGSLPPRACALTFDDGWKDNFEFAFPVLQRHAAPATIFIVSGMTGTHCEFWPNRLARRLAQLRPGEELPEPLGRLLAPVIEQARRAGEWSLQDLDRAVVLSKQLGDEQIRMLLDEKPAGAAAAASDRTVLNEDELRIMAASGLVRFGSHTRTHRRFRSDLPREVLEQEVAGSLAEIAETAGEAGVGVFCYPNGDTTPEAVAAVRRHYRAAVTTRKGWHRTGMDPFLIPRIGVHEDISNRPAAFIARISGLL